MEILLKDKTTFDVLDTSTANQLQVEYATLEEVEQLRAALTKENLSKFSFTDAEGNVYGTYEDYVFDGNVSYSVSDGTYKATFSLRTKTTEEKQEEKIKILEEALLELSDVVYAE